MKNLFGLTDIRTQTIIADIKSIDIEINSFTRTHDANIIDIQTHITVTGSVIAIIIYQR